MKVILGEVSSSWEDGYVVKRGGIVETSAAASATVLLEEIKERQCLMAG